MNKTGRIIRYDYTTLDTALENFYREMADELLPLANDVVDALSADHKGIGRGLDFTETVDKYVNSLQKLCVYSLKHSDKFSELVMMLYFDIQDKKRN